MPTRPSQTAPEQLAKWDELRRQVGARVRATRIERGLTQEALALEAGFSRNLLIEVEHGRTGLLYERLVDLAGVLGVAPYILLTGGSRGPAE